MRFSDEVGTYELDSLPGCAQICVSHNAFVFPVMRGQKKAEDWHKRRLAEIKRLGYDRVICTVRINNLAQIKILERNGWSKMHEFTSSYSGNVVQLYIRIL